VPLLLCGCRIALAIRDFNFFQMKGRKKKKPPNPSPASPPSPHGEKRSPCDGNPLRQIVPPLRRIDRTLLFAFPPSPTQLTLQSLFPAIHRIRGCYKLSFLDKTPRKTEPAWSLSTDAPYCRGIWPHLFQNDPPFPTPQAVSANGGGTNTILVNFLS